MTSGGSATLQVADEDTVGLCELAVMQEPEVSGAGSAYCVGSPGTGEFIKVGEEAVFLLDRLREGASVSAAKSAFRDRYGEEPELGEFLSGLAECGFVESIGGRPLEQAPRSSRGLLLLAGLTQCHCRWLLSRPLTWLAVGAWLLLPALLLLQPALVPKPSDALVYHDVFLLVALFVPVGWFLVCFHELAHSLVGRALGCPAYTRMGNRLWHLVCETDLSSIYALPRQLRYRPLLAGMAWDAIVLDSCLLLRAAGVEWRPLRLIAFMLFSGMAFQFAIFMRTDLYFVVATATRIDNLLAHARAEVRNLVARLRRHPSRVSDLTPSRRLFVRAYVAGCAVGLAISLRTFVGLTVPVTAGMLRLAASTMGRGPSQASFWTATATFAILVGLNTVLIATHIRNRRAAGRRRATQTRITAAGDLAGEATAAS